MRPFEIVLLVSIASWIVAWWRRPERRHGQDAAAARWAPTAMVVVALVAHGMFEGARWNLAGVYALASAVVAVDGIGALRSARPRPVSRTRRTVRAVLVGLLLALLAAPAVVLPVPNLPAPTGPWPVGTTSIEFLVPADAGSEEAAPVRARARLWYPAAGTEEVRTAQPAPWLEHFDAMLPALGRRAGLPGWTLGHLEHTRVHAVWNAPLGGEGSLGIVTFDHGRGGFAAQNTFLAEELASHGWLVVAPEHPGGAFLTVFRDGTRTPFDPASFGEGLDGQAYADAIRALGRRWAGETAAALDALTAGAGPAGLADRLDRNRLVVSGHSTGGGSAFALCGLEPGCRAVVGLDPWLLPVPPELFGAVGDDGSAAQAQDATLPPHVLALFSDFDLGFFEPENFAAFQRLAAAVDDAGGEARHEVFAGAGHMDFADVGLLSPVADRLGLYVGPAPPREVLPRIRQQVVSLLNDAFLER